VTGQSKERTELKGVLQGAKVENLDKIRAHTTIDGATGDSTSKVRAYNKHDITDPSGLHDKGLSRQWKTVYTDASAGTQKQTGWEWSHGSKASSAGTIRDWPGVHRLGHSKEGITTLIDAVDDAASNGTPDTKVAVDAPQTKPATTATPAAGPPPSARAAQPRDPETGRFISNRSAQAREQPRDEHGRFVKAATAAPPPPAVFAQ